MNTSPDGFQITLQDGSIKSEKDILWSEISRKEKVDYFSGKKTVYVCTLPVKEIKIYYDELEALIDVPEGCQVYQAIRARADYLGGEVKGIIVGKCVGIIRDGVIIEERFLNGVEHEVQGMKK